MLRWAMALCVLATAADGATASSADLDWTVVEADCDYGILRHERTDEARRRGIPVENLVVRATIGTYIHAQRAIEPARIVEDLVAGVWIKADRQGLQVRGRVVLPRSVDPQTGEPYRVLIAGQSYRQPGLWQKLNVSDTPRELQRSVRVLRARTNESIDLRGAYLEALVLNVFGGPGTTRAWIDQVELEGCIAPDPLQGEPIADASSETETSWVPLEPEDRPRLRVETLHVGGRPYFPRVIEHRGEEFELLQQLGFNTVFLPTPATPEQFEQAQQRGLWLVCPPPDEVEQARPDGPILAWFCGHELSEHPQATLWTERLRRRDPGQRPLIAGAEHNQWVASRQVDILLRRRLPLGTTMELSQFGPWLQTCTQLARPGTPFWSTVQTELSENVLQQAETWTGPPSDPPSAVEAEQVRQLTLASIAAGARGLWFASSHPLNDGDSSTQLRRLFLERMNLESLLMAPWAMGGQPIGEVPAANSEYRVQCLSTERSRLLIPTRQHHHSQLVCHPASRGNSLVVAGVPDSIDAFLLTPVGLRPVQHRRISGGLHLETDPLDSDSLILLTQDPLVISHMNRIIYRIRNRAAELEYQIASWQWKDLQQQSGIDQKTMHLVSADLAEAESSLQTCGQLLKSQDAAAIYRFARQSQSALARVRSMIWHRRMAEYGTPLAHPSGAAFALSQTLAANDIPLSDDDWGANLLPCGDCEQLPQMVSAGWRQHRTPTADLTTYIALSPHRPHSGNHCLRLRAESQTKETDVQIAESPAIWVHTAPITVRPGQIVRISGWIRIDQPLPATPDGCLISDSISGPELGLRFYETDGWQPFQMLRSIAQHDHLTVTITLSGLGEVYLDDLQVRTLTEESRLALRKKQ